MSKSTKELKSLPTSKITQGDCIQTMNSWPKDSLDLIFADPPYNIGYDYDKYDDTKSYDDYVSWTGDWIDACSRLLKPSGSFYILIGDEYAAETRMHLRKLERQGDLLVRNWIIWHYTFGQNARAKFNRSHVHLFYCVGSGIFKDSKGRKNDKVQLTPPLKSNLLKNPPYAFNKQDIAIQSARQSTYGDKRANPTGKMPDDTWYLRPQEAFDGGENYFDVDCDTWSVSRLCGTFQERVAWHPCQLPEALLERIVKLSSNKGDIVFDPFTGSGTTLAVAAMLGRQWLGTELSEDYATKSQKRIEHVQATGETMRSTQQEKGMDRKNPKKKPEPYRSAPGAKTTSTKATPATAETSLFGDDVQP
jgi:site-specific DNA-methyltransferase (adenine-specific)